MSERVETFFVNLMFAIIVGALVVFGIALLVGSYMREKAAEDAMAAARYERVYLAGGAR